METNFERLIVIPEERQYELEQVVLNAEHAPVFNKNDVERNKKEIYFIPATYYTTLLNKLKKLILIHGGEKV